MPRRVTWRIKIIIFPWEVRQWHLVSAFKKINNTIVNSCWKWMPIRVTWSAITSTVVIFCLGLNRKPIHIKTEASSLDTKTSQSKNTHNYENSWSDQFLKTKKCIRQHRRHASKRTTNRSRSVDIFHQPLTEVKKFSIDLWPFKDKFKLIADDTSKSKTCPWKNKLIQNIYQVA